jgi:hypothetical protein
MYKDTTSEFCPQGHLTGERLENPALPCDDVGGD